MSGDNGFDHSFDEDVATKALKLATRVDGEVIELRGRVLLLDRDVVKSTYDLGQIRDELRVDVKALHDEVERNREDMRAVAIRFEKALVRLESLAKPKRKKRRKS